jgi:hypothetical protein
VEAIFDRAGRTVAWRLRDVVFDLEGQAVALVHNRALFSREGRFLAHFQDGWVRDERGSTVACEAGATGGPLPPVPLPLPVAPPPEVRPPQPTFDPAPPLRVRAIHWSERRWADIIGAGEGVAG